MSKVLTESGKITSDMNPSINTLEDPFKNLSKKTFAFI